MRDNLLKVLEFDRIPYLIFQVLLYIAGSVLSDDNLWLSKLMNLLFLYSWFWWVLASSVFLRKSLQKDDKVNFQLFSICLTVVFLFFSISILTSSDRTEELDFLPIWLLVIVLTFVASFFYMILYLRNLIIEKYGFEKISERFRGLILLFFALWIFPIGYWVVHPLIHETYLSEIED